MGISKLTAAKIHNCIVQIEEGYKMIEAMKESIAKTGDVKLEDAFGGQRGIEMGIPLGSSSGHRILNVRPGLAIDVITAHIEDKKKELERLNDLAKIELA